MKTRHLLILLSFFLLSAVTQAQGPKITFDKKIHDFGDITDGDVVEYVFTFTNTGNAPLIISNVITPCGCTVPVWTKEPIMPGTSSELKVTFNSHGKSGIQRKMIKVISNTGDNDFVSINANVLPKVK